MAEQPNDRPIQWDTEAYVLDVERSPEERAAVGERSEEGKVAELFGVPALAQELFDKGLVFLVNQNVLHHYGYALGATGYKREEDGVERFFVTGLCLFKTDDPDGIWFDEATVVAGREKLREAGLR